MEIDVKKVGKTALKVVGAACVATGVVVVSSVIASGVAAGTVAKSFGSAKNAAKRILGKDDVTEAASEETMEDDSVKFVEEQMVEAE